MRGPRQPVLLTHCRRTPTHSQTMRQRARLRRGRHLWRLLTVLTLNCCCSRARESSTPHTHTHAYKSSIGASAPSATPVGLAVAGGCGLTYRQDWRQRHVSMCQQGSRRRVNASRGASAAAACGPRTAQGALTCPETCLPDQRRATSPWLRVLRFRRATRDIAPWPASPSGHARRRPPPHGSVP